MGIITNLENLNTKKCTNCGKEFKPSHPAEAFCSEGCQIVYRIKYQQEYRKRHRVDDMVEWLLNEK